MSCIDTLRLSTAEQTELLHYLEGDESGDGSANLRQHARLSYHPAAGIVISLSHPGGSVGLYLVRPRNLSAGGIGFLHGSYLHQGSRCGLVLRTVDGQRRTLCGHVAWCRHVRGHVHEAGIAFHETIDVRQFVDTCLRMDPAEAEGEAATSVPLPKLRGRALYVEDTPDDRALLAFQLGQMGVELHCVADVPEAMARLNDERFDLVLTGLWLPGLTGLDLIEQVNEMDAPPPVIALTADPNETVHREALQRGGKRVLVKPYTFQTLVDVLTPYLGPAEGAEPVPPEPLISRHWSTPAMRPLLSRYVARLDEQVEQIAQLLASTPPDPLLRKLVLEMKGSAGNFGYPAVSEAAHRLYELIEQQADAAALHDEQVRLKQLALAAKAGIESAESSDSD